MRTIHWQAKLETTQQLKAMYRNAAEPGLLVIRFAENCAGPSAEWKRMEPWTCSRAITISDVRTDLSCPALGVALCADLLYLREDSKLVLPGPDEAPSPAVIWASRRAGRRALQFCLFGHPTRRLFSITAGEAVDLGLAAAVLPHDADLPLPDPRLHQILTAVSLSCTFGGDHGLWSR